MTGHTDWRAQRYAAKSAAWLAGRDEFNRQFAPYPPDPPYAGQSAKIDFIRGWEAARDDYDEARDRAREDRQHYPLSPLSAFERNRP